MSRVAAAGVTGSAITASLGPQLVGGSGQDLCVREVGVFNNAAVATHVGIAKLSALGTQGTALTEVNLDTITHTIVGAATNIASGSPTLGGPIRWGVLGAAIGSGIIWTFPENGLIIPAGAATGLTIYCPAGTGQVVSFYFEWEE